MYCAFATEDTPRTRGTTRLHMDMSDAFNVMTYAEKTPSGDAGYAVWDIFRPEDASKIRQYLLKRHNLCSVDPIHRQQYYLDKSQMEELWKEYGVKSHHVIQKPGDGVFIPAGCAHQVSVYRLGSWC
jgi:[histone H3]-dimethyl-L-lysine9 demethylase